MSTLAPIGRSLRGINIYYYIMVHYTYVVDFCQVLPLILCSITIKQSLTFVNIMMTLHVKEVD